jgi:hypothetical protein
MHSRVSSPRFPEATTFHYLYTILEDQVLEAWVQHAITYKRQHMSLHFDGVRISKEQDLDVEAFCRASEHAIEDRRNRVGACDLRRAL